MEAHDSTVASVVAEDLGKSYRVYANPWARLGEALFRRTWHRSFTAVEGVTFELPRGEGLGVIGENGAGKSTLLKMLAGIVEPTAGRLEVRGKVASILELGSGFHPEFTGRQNIVLNAAMLGLSEDEVREKTPQIIEFSELGHFIDQPVKTYSTGMGMRLGFSIATQVEPDVLIVDEALSVGDGYFQKKCMERLQRFVAEGGTLLFCSHAMYYVSAFCQRAIWLREGRVAAQGRTEEVVREYEGFLTAKSRAAEAARAEGLRAAEGESVAPGPARIETVRLLSAEGAAEGVAEGGVDGDDLPDGTSAPRRYRPGDRLAIEVEWRAEEGREAAEGFHLGIGVNRVDEVEVLSFATHLDEIDPITGAGRHRLRLEVPELPLAKGLFTVYVFLLDRDGLHVYDRRILLGALEMESPSYLFGMVAAEHRWHSPTERADRGADDRAALAVERN